MRLGIGRFGIVANAVRMRFVVLADWLYGCPHRNTSFPITLRAGVSVNGPHSTAMDTYVVCLECGRHFAYDWTTIRITRQRWLGPAAAGFRQAARCDGDA